MSKKVPIHLQSSQNRFLIKNGTVVNDDKAEKVDVYIEEGKVKQMGSHLIIPGGTRTIDATDKFVLPGGIDANVHLQKPHSNVTQTIDDFYQGTRAALLGGTTTVIDCVEPTNGESLMDAYNRWRGWAEDKVCCNYALKVGLKAPLSGEMKQEMEDLTKEEFGVNAFHLSMIGEGRFDDPQLLDTFSFIRQLGCLAQVHAESGELVDREAKQLLSQGISGPEGFAMAHSETSEEEATMRATTLANHNVCPLYVCPVMSASAAEIIKKKKENGNVVFGETTPAALACDGEEYWNECWRHAAGFVCEPPIRKGQKEAILDHLVKAPNSGLEILASANCTFNSSQKSLGSRDFTKIPTGVNGAQERMAILWEHGVHSGKMDPTQFVALTSANPAKIFNMYPEKGRIEVGSEADIVIWNPSAKRIISAKDHAYKVDFNIFEGQEVHGIAETVICQGKVMVDEGQIRIMQGFGRFQPLPPFCDFIYNQVREREMAAAEPRPVARVVPDPISNGNGSIPPPTPTKSGQATPAASQHSSSVDLTSHPNPVEEIEMRASPTRSSVRVRAPPGGKSSGSFW